MTKLKPPLEKQEQRTLIHWWKMQYPEWQDHLIMIGNEVKCSPVTGRLRNLEGRVTGASDLLLAIPAGPFSGIFIEMKQDRKYVPSEKQTSSWIRQEKFQASMRKVGYATAFAFGWENAKFLINDYLKLCPDGADPSSPG